jgi:quinol monooxygenase YgiN
MADIVEIRFRVGSGEAGIALYEKAHPKVLTVLESGKYPGFIVHTCEKTADGVRVIDVWEDAAQWQAVFADPEVIEIMKALGAPEPEVEIRPLHNVMRAEVTANA